MDCLIELYDHDQLNNLVDILAFRPKKVVFIFDKRETRSQDLQAIKLACRKVLPNIRIEAVPITPVSLEEITRTCKQVIHQNPDCYMDVTGGGELNAIGAYLACRSTFTPIFKVDMINGIFINVYGCKSMEDRFSFPTLSMDVLLLAHGAVHGGHGHTQPSDSWFDPLFRFCQEIFQDISGWKNFCFYLQPGCTAYPASSPLFFSAPAQIPVSNGSYANGDKSFFHLASQLELISDYQQEKHWISFTFSNSSIRHYLTDYGTCLELYTYISLSRSNAFHDVQMSVKIDWNGERKIPVEVTNEIDVTCFYGIHPVFISCKLSEPSSEALQELSIYRSYFGGRHSRCVLVTLSSLDPDRSYSVWRAKEMGIHLIDGNSIRRGTLVKDMIKALKDSKTAPRG